MTLSFDILFGLVPALVAVAAIVLSFVVYVAMHGSAKEERERPFVYEYFYWFIEPLVSLLARAGVKPNQVTGTSLLLSSLAAAALGTGHWFIGTWLLMVASSCDVVDGFLARSTGQSGPAGAFFDSFVDRLAEGVVFMGLAYAGQGGVLTIGAIAALIGSYGVSYARARGEGLGVVAKVGLMQRPVRLVGLIVFILAAAFSTLMPDAVVAPVTIVGVGTLIIAFGAMGTAVHRAHWVMRELARIDDSPTPLDESSVVESRSAA